MLLDCEHIRYRKPQLMEVICQLRYPTILTIETQLPATFQELIRNDYPRYSLRKEALPPQMNRQSGQVTVEKVETANNYQFVSQDGMWKVNLTKDFIAIATRGYTVWEDFATRLDKLLAAFIEAYHPAFFERIGLRFINAFSRNALGLNGTPFSELIAPSYLGLMAEEDLQEHNFIRIQQDAEVKLPGGGNLRVHAGPGIVQRDQVKDKEIRFILDNDVSMGGNIPLKQVAPTLNTIHSQADRVFHGAITKTLHDAMEPMEL